MLKAFLHNMNSNYRIITAFTILLLFLAVIPSSAVQKHRKVIFVVADRLTLDDLSSSSTPSIGNLVQKSSVAIISPACIGKKSPNSVYASVSSGSPARGSEALDDLFSRKELIAAESASAEDVYRRRTGLSPEEDQSLLITIGSITRVNEDSGFPNNLGALGNAIRKAGLSTAAFGNSDIRNRKLRLPAVIAMDGSGRIARGNVGATFDKPGLGPTGVVTDVFKLADAVHAEIDRSAFIVVHFGDTERLDEMERSLSPRAYEIYREVAIKNLDSLIDRLMRTAEDNDAVLLVASFVAPGANNWSNLTPMLIFDPDAKRVGLITTATTRTPGLISAIDVAPVVLNSMGLPLPDKMMGRTATVIESKDKIADTKKLAGTIRRNTAVQAPLLGSAAAIGMLCLIFLAAMAASGGTVGKGNLFLVTTGVIFALDVTVAALILSKVAPATPLPYSATIVGAAFLMALLTSAAATIIGKMRRTKANAALPMVVFSAVAAAAVIADAFSTGALARFSSIPSFGFRYYGIGNEYMGLAIGCLCTIAIWISGPIFSKRAKRVYLGLFILATSAIAFPGLGTNAGGAIAAVVTFGLLYVALCRGRFSPKHVAIMVGAAFLLLFLLAFVDLATNGPRASHIGESLQATQRGGAGYLAGAAVRKVGMNVRQLATRQGRLALMGAAPLAVIWFMSIHPKLLKKSRQGAPASTAALVAVLVGAITAAISNDNGIIAASLMLTPVIPAVLLSLTEETDG